MKKLLGFLFVAMVLFVSFASCNDDGTGEPLKDPAKKKTVKERVLIQKDPAPLKVRYAAIGIGAWALASAIGYGGHAYLNRKK